MTRVYKPVEALTEAELRALPRSAYSDAEWESLKLATKKYIVANDPVAKAADEARAERIENFVEFFVARHNAIEDSRNYDGNDFGDDFDYLFGEAADEVVEKARYYNHREVEEIEEHFTSEGFSEEQVAEALKEALQDNNNYEYEYGTDEYRGAMFKASTTQSFYVDREEMSEQLDAFYDIGLSDEEIEEEIAEALKAVNRKTYLNLKPKDLDFKHELSIDEYVTIYADANPHWDRVTAAVESLLGDQGPEAEPEPELPAEERVIHRFKDDSYVLKLLPGELAAEGKMMGICVGREEYGYAKAVKAGRTQILSLRRPSGKPLFTFEVKMDAGRPEKVVQIKGKANRLPGWDLGKTGQGTVKADEVEKAIKIVEVLKLDPEEVADLRPGFRALKSLPPMRENHGDDVHCGFCRGPA